jgi:hypothetical protein
MNFGLVVQSPNHELVLAFVIKVSTGEKQVGTKTATGADDEKIF